MVRASNLHFRLSVLTLFVRIILGIVIVLFSKCMVALFDPGHRRGGSIRWGLVTYTVAMFSLVTIGTSTLLDAQSISYVDNREFPGARGVLRHGPAGYQELISSKGINVASNVAFVLSNWLAEGLLVSSLLMLHLFNHVANADYFSFIVATSSTP